MPDYLLLMHDDANADGDWGAYLQKLRHAGKLQGGSAIGRGICVRKAGQPPPVSEHVVGFIRIEAESLDEARALLAGNPVYENGGTVEIRELPKTN
jgi:hypothetical protein